MLGVIMLVVWAATVAFAAGLWVGMGVGTQTEKDRRMREGR